ncbi:MAG: hypothetical protein IJ126_00755 [Lachnospiraceae bacterium]|nr:hypothetical protein [Lachnospiraceae bacterium]
MQKNHKGYIVKKAIIAAAVVFAVLAVSFGVYVSDYYRADESVKAFLVSDEKVRVEETVRLVMEAVRSQQISESGN